MSARLVLVLFAALAIFALAQEEDAATKCTTSRHGDLDGLKKTRNRFLSEGNQSAVYDLQEINPCYDSFSINGVEVKVCDRAGFVVIRISNTTAAVSRSSSTTFANIELDFYCRDEVTQTNP